METTSLCYHLDRIAISLSKAQVTTLGAEPAHQFYLCPTTTRMD